MQSLTNVINGLWYLRSQEASYKCKWNVKILPLLRVTCKYLGKGKGDGLDYS